MDLVLTLSALVSFFALVVAWVAMPQGDAPAGSARPADRAAQTA